MDKPKDAIELEQVIIKNSDGKRIATFGANDQDCPELQLYDKEGKSRCIIGLAPDGVPIVSLLNAEEKPLILVSTNPDTTGITIRDANNAPRLQVQVSTSGERTGVIFSGTNGETQAILSNTSDGMVSLALCDKEGKPAIGLFVNGNGDPSLVTEKLGNVLQAFITE